MRSTQEILKEMNEELHGHISTQGIKEASVRVAIAQVYILEVLIDLRDEQVRHNNEMERIVARREGF